MWRKVVLCLVVLLMALNIDLRVLTQPGATGNQTISLPANFDPKAIILWTSGLAAAGTGVHGQFGMGYGTYRGAAVQQYCVAGDSRDAATTGNTCSEAANNALLVLHIAAAPGARDLEIDLVSMQTGATSQVVINWVNLHTTASILVNCLILGGSDITDALAFDFACTASVATQDVTVVAGFGQPDFLMLAGWYGETLLAFNSVNVHSTIALGFGKKGQAGRCLSYSSRDGNTNMFVGMSQRSDHLLRHVFTNVDPPTDLALFALDTNPAANWPTDGFQINYTTQALDAAIVIGLALKGTFTATTGNGTAPTSGGLPVVQNLDHGSAPKLGFIMGWDLIGATGINSTGATLGAFFVGAGNGTVECVAGLTDDDGLGTSDCNRFWTDTKVVRNYNQAAALQSEADGLISGNNFQLSWNDIDTVALEYQWFTLGDAVAAVDQLPMKARRALQPEQVVVGRASYAV